MSLCFCVYRDFIDESSRNIVDLFEAASWDNISLAVRPIPGCTTVTHWLEWERNPRRQKFYIIKYRKVQKDQQRDSDGDDSSASFEDLET